MPPTGRLVFEKNVEIPMRDGTILRADIYRPDDDEQHPVLVSRTPYGKEPGSAGNPGDTLTVQAASAGYAVVTQDVRGRATSDGVFYPFLNEAEDGYDTIEWAAAQPWSTGKVGETPEASPSQPSKRYPGAGTAVKITVVPAA